LDARGSARPSSWCRPERWRSAFPSCS
jgi:hypothetical protein